MPSVPRTATRRTERPLRVNSTVSKTQQYLVLKHEAAALLDRADQIKKDLMSEVAENGAEDDKGSLFLDLPTPIEVGGQTFTSLKREKRTSITLDEDKAREILAEKGLLERTTKTIEVLDQDELYVLYQEDLLSDADMDALFKKNVSWAFKPIAS